MCPAGTPTEESWGEQKAGILLGFVVTPPVQENRVRGRMDMAVDRDDKLKLEYTLYCSADMAIAPRGWEESWTWLKHNATSKKISI